METSYDIPLKPESTRFTDSQWQAIYDGGKNILVSASAGSGKTTVLVRRVIEKIKQGVSLDELLVVTYTNAAAREMKERIQEAIQQEINAEPEPERRRHLVKQLPLISHADISTLHSFCLKVIRRYYYLIDLDPVFRLLTDDTEMTLMQEDVWNELREELYGEENEQFEKLATAFSNDRSDDGLTELIFSLYQFSRANPDPKAWLESLSTLYDVPNGDLTQTFVFQQLAKPQWIQTFDTIIELIHDAALLGNGEEELEKTLEKIEEDRLHYENIRKAIESNQLEEAYLAISQFNHPRWYAPNKKSTPEEVKETAKEMKLLRDKAKDLYTNFVEQFFQTSIGDQVAAMQEIKPLTEEMARVAALFSQRYQEQKEERKVLDFNDLEHLTLQILSQQTEEGEWIPTEASHYYRSCFKEVMVDEYQDINLLQESILRWLTKSNEQNGNQFMVGDVKQSIYAFRLADPSLFLEKYEAYESGNQGERIILAENFRSRKDVLDFTNFLFIQLMDKEVGNLTYDEYAKLVHGFTAFPQSDQFNTEILIYEKEVDEEEESSDDESEELNEGFQIDSKTKGELLMVAEKILEMKRDGFEIYDKKTKEMRPIQLNDIVLLTPTKKNNLIIQDVFKQLGIATAVRDTQNYFQTTEITIMMSLLKIIDNPRQDIPLVAVLRSPIVGLNEVDLTKIRLENKQANYYEALLAFSEKEMVDERNKHLQLKVKDFLQQLQHWREKARRRPLVDLIWMIYEETGFLHYVGGMSSGKQRKANLHALYERAASYEKTSFKGLFQFIRFIEKMQKKDKDLAEPSSVTEGEEAVRVMTIHASKGLEFPVVFVLDLSKQFNQQDLRKPYVFDETYGVGVDYRNEETRQRIATLPEQVLKNQKKNKLLSEEMRVLYVALTRAEQKLFLVGSYKNEEKAWNEWATISGHEETVLPADMRLSAKSFMSWIGMCLVRHQLIRSEQWLPNQNKEVSEHAARFSLSFFNQQQLEEKLSEFQSEETSDWYPQLKDGTLKWESDSETLKSVDEALKIVHFSYPQTQATQTTSYQSVSEIKRLFEEPDDGQMVKIDVTNPTNQHRYVEDEWNRPRFITEKAKPTPAEIGQATHLVLQALDLSTDPSISTIKDLVSQLTDEGVLQEEVAPLIETNKIAEFFQTELGETIVKDHASVRREVPFSLLMEARDIFQDMDELDDHVLVHGIIDGYIEREDGLVLFDYKTDQVKRFGSRAEEEMRKKYSGQINLYRKALESIMEKSVTHAYLVLLDTTEIIEI
jgi:ATP-dependent helicase/nuclease subunit A